MRKEGAVEDAALEKKKAAEADAAIARRLENLLRVTREDEAKHLAILKMRRLERRARKPNGSK